MKYENSVYDPRAQLTLKVNGMSIAMIELGPRNVTSLIPDPQPFVSYAQRWEHPMSQEDLYNEGGAQWIHLKSEKADIVQLGFNSQCPDLIIEGDSLRFSVVITKLKITFSDSYFVVKVVRCKMTALNGWRLCERNMMAIFCIPIVWACNQGLRTSAKLWCRALYKPSLEDHVHPNRLRLPVDFVKHLPSEWALCQLLILVFLDGQSLELGTVIQITGKLRKSLPCWFSIQSSYGAQDNILTVIDLYISC